VKYKHRQAQKIAEELLKLTDNEKILLIVKFSNKCKELMEENEKLKTENLTLKGENDQLEFKISVAESKIEELESKVAYCEN